MGSTFSYGPDGICPFCGETGEFRWMSENHHCFAVMVIGEQVEKQEQAERQLTIVQAECTRLLLENRILKIQKELDSELLGFMRTKERVRNYNDD